MSDDILLVDDDVGTIQLLAQILTGMGTLRFATSGEGALQMARDAMPDLILLDAQMAGMNGFEVCEALKADASLAHVPVIFITSHGGPEFEVSGFDVGAADFIAKPVSAPLVRARVNTQLRLKHQVDDLRRLATIDMLTGLVNRGGFDAALEREWRRTRRSGDPITLLMIDVDHFKLFNDRYGHPAGDICLQAVARALAGIGLRPADLVARYGGEEFVMLLPGTARDGAEHIAGNVLDAIDALLIPHPASPAAANLTVSVGVSFYDNASESWRPGSTDSGFAEDLGTCCSHTALVETADRALYSAKHAGRGCACLLDIADGESPHLARCIGATRRPVRRDQH